VTRTIQEKKFEEIYYRLINGICIPMGKIQHARRHKPSEKKGTTSPINSADKDKWIEVKNKATKVRFMCQDPFSKTCMNG
jgi:hypothetical protein